MTLAEMPTISVIVPTFNEQVDIRRTCDALTCLDYPRKEILIVDDASTDCTVSIVREYVAGHQFRLIEQPANRGVASARNVGIQHATGEVIVILNADVSPESDFLRRIAAHYRDGAHYVTVESRVANTEFFLPRYGQAFYEVFHGGRNLVGWSEGFSCLHQCALQAGLFPEVFPGASGEDVVFMERLSAQCMRGVVDHSIIVPHVAPHRLKDFWSQYRGRGRGFVYYRFYFGKVSLGRLAFTRVLTTLATLAQVGLIIPGLSLAMRLCQHSPKRYGDLLPFCLARAIQLLAHKYGEWKGLAELYARSKDG
jgi:glycosyltransferase involved in cell wall biosynthesis